MINDVLNRTNWKVGKWTYTFVDLQKITEGRDDIKILIRFQTYLTYSYWSKIHLEANPIWGIKSLMCNEAQNLSLFSSCVLDIYSYNRWISERRWVSRLTFFLTEIFHLHLSYYLSLATHSRNALWVKSYYLLDFLPRCGWTSICSPARPSALCFWSAKDHLLPPHTLSYHFLCSYFFLVCLLGKKHHS